MLVMSRHVFGALEVAISTLVKISKIVFLYGSFDLDHVKTYASGCARCKTQDEFSLRFCFDFPIETAWLFLGQQSSTSMRSSSSSL